ncbi:PadR family transcriptional regulator [Aurantimonas sp. E1-2-R+4]|uniref:PadR family transcriptional regulator n=1 Tax=Aurantimonas sp. E1-2-R+4 TaxID=3113714 RepID=UPI003FA5A283
MLALLRCGPRSTSADVFKVLAERLQKEPSFGAVFTTLDRLADKKLLISDYIEDPDRKGRRRRFFTLTGQGSRILSDALREGTRLAEGLGASFPAGSECN